MKLDIENNFDEKMSLLLEENQILLSANEEAIGIIERVEIERKKLQRESVLSQNEITNLKEQNITLTELIDEKSNDILNLKEKLENKIVESAKYQDDIKNLKTELGKLQEDVGRYQTEISEYQTEISEYQAEIRDCQMEKTFLQTEYDNNLKEKIDEIQDLQMTIEKLKKDVEKKNKSITSLKNSWSYRVGRIILWIPRKIRLFFKKHG